MTYKKSTISLPISLWSRLREKQVGTIQEFIQFSKNEKKQVSWISVQLKVNMIQGKSIRSSWGAGKVGLFAFFIKLTAVSFIKWQKIHVYREECLTEIGSLSGPQQEPDTKLKIAKIQLLVCAKKMREKLLQELPAFEISILDINGRELTNLCQIILEEAETLGICENDMNHLCDPNI
ncbi:MAG: hypothetical protein KAH77_12250 [Thiomargarita sp.]|nr:hypothetical protein [Thiomargarita sp.]